MYPYMKGMQMKYLMNMNSKTSTRTRHAVSGTSIPWLWRIYFIWEQAKKSPPQGVIFW